MGESGQSTRRVFPPAGENTTSCSHEAVERLGVDAGQNRYLRCRDCEAVIVAFSTTSRWEQQRDELAREPRDWHPLLDALRTKRSGPQEDPRRDESNRNREPETLTDRVRQTWYRFFSGRP